MAVRPPAWLDELQRGFSAVLRSPLSSDSGTFAEDSTGYPTAFLDSLEESSSTSAARLDRLALYHRQYWMRLFTVLQGHYPRFSWSVGYFHFNRLVALFLDEHAPSSFDIDEAGSGLGSFLKSELAERAQPQVGQALTPLQHVLRESQRDRRLLVEALKLDTAERRVFCAVLAPTWTPSAGEIPRLPERRLQYAPGFAVVREHWDLAPHSALFRAEGATQQAKEPLELPQPRCWVFFRTPSGVSLLQVRGEQAAFLSHCRRMSFGAALQRLQATATSKQLEVITAELSGWVRQAVDLGWWVGTR